MLHDLTAYLQEIQELLYNNFSSFIFLNFGYLSILKMIRKPIQAEFFQLLKLAKCTWH